MQAASISRENTGEKLLVVLVFTLIISVMNATMFNVALPSIRQEFALTASQVSWVVTGYIVVYAIGSVTFGKLADKYRLKDLLTFGLIFFALGSTLGLAATHYWMLIVGRVLQAAGASVIPATAMLIPVRYFPAEKRGRALGVISSGLALGTAIGPVVAGFVTSTFSWRFLFLLSILSLITLPFYRKFLDDEKGTASKTDLLGGALLGGTIAALLLSITQGSLLDLILGLVLLVLFILRIRTAAEPFIQPALFQNRQYTWGIVISFLASGLSFGIPFLTPMMFTTLNHVSPATIGFFMFPGAILAALLARRAGRLADEKGNTALGSIALSLLFLAYGLLSVVAGLSPWVVMCFLIFGNLGQTFIQIANSNLISRTLSKQHAGVGMGLMMMVNFIAGATATSIIGKVLDFGPTLQLNPLLMQGEGVVYSNIFLFLAVGVIVIATLFYYQFGKKRA
ncbi:MFS transporter [Tumebacillus permanentifrigoris]|uniref:DHA2 family metal-tetracycline-proton antiporter-like MFS transporter n=1 Tax=Tumebacillus permanentifrigoris TaxID=378543 RepID=A0A316DEL1_9BACL|nr:MFS transporter [Tumebacillus permanentifrigoris]PWK16484.1 DHA2 family metal-tetracycline-proton antiporter-like MFS transporter [Tumebacillus permanentifrigoris]